MRQLPPLSGLQAFEAAARHLSFTEAAKELNCTQAAISQRVRALESYLSRRLFVRKSNGLQLSEVGEAYFPGVAQALNAAAAATDGLQVKKHVPHTVTVSAPVSFLTLWLMPRLESLLADEPRIELRMNSAIWTDPNAELADLTVEVVDADQLETSVPRLPPERLILVGAPDMAAAFAAEPLAAGLATCRKIVIQGRHDLWHLWAAGLKLEIRSEMPDMKVDNAVMALEAAARGLGVTVAYARYCAPYLASGKLVTLPGSVFQTDLCFALSGGPDKLAWHPAHRVFSRLAQAFKDDMEPA